MAEELTLTDGELIITHNLEFLTDVEEKSGTTKKIGFARGRLVILNVKGAQSKAVTIEIGDSFYETLRRQAVKGKYDSAREFLANYERTSETIPLK